MQLRHSWRRHRELDRTPVLFALMQGPEAACEIPVGLPVAHREPTWRVSFMQVDAGGAPPCMHVDFYISALSVDMKNSRWHHGVEKHGRSSQT
jgi:hypothetical protein